MVQSFRDVFFPEKLPPLVLESQPIAVDNPMDVKRDPKSTAVAVVVHALIFLLIFILQNLDPARIRFLGLQAELPLGIWMLFAAIAGVLLLAIPGLGRMIQWRRASKGSRR